MIIIFLLKRQHIDWLRIYLFQTHFTCYHTYSSKQPSWVNFIFYFTDNKTNNLENFLFWWPLCLSLMFHFVCRYYFILFLKLTDKYVSWLFQLTIRFKLSKSWGTQFSFLLFPVTDFLPQQLYECTSSLYLLLHFLSTFAVLGTELFNLFTWPHGHISTFCDL